MNLFTIKDIENLSGIKAHTWRIWELRYNLGIAQRKLSKHRYYDDENLKQVLRISYLYQSGMKISNIARLSEEEIKDAALQFLPGEKNYEFYIKELLEASLDLDEERFERTFDQGVQLLGLEASFMKVVNVFQEKIGVLWLTDHIIPAQEHFTSNIIRQKLSFAIDELPAVAGSENNLILFTPANEEHELPLQFIHYVLKKNGLKVLYLGKNVGLDTITQYAATRDCTHLLFYLVTNFTNTQAQDYLKEVCSMFTDKTVVMTGRESRQIDEPPKNARLLYTAEDILAFTKSLQ